MILLLLPTLSIYQYPYRLTGPQSLADEANPLGDYIDWINMFGRIDKAGGYAQHRSGNGSSTGNDEAPPVAPAPSSSTVHGSLSYPDPVGGVAHVGTSGCFSSYSLADSVPLEHTPPMQSSSGAGAFYTEGQVAIPGSSPLYPGAFPSTATTLGDGTGTVSPSMVDDYWTNVPMAYQYPSAPHGMTMHPAWQDGQSDVHWDYRQPDTPRVSREQDVYAYPFTFNHADSNPVVMTSAYTVIEASSVGAVDSTEYEQLAFNQDVNVLPPMYVPEASYLPSSSDTVIDPREDTQTRQLSSVDTGIPLPAWSEELEHDAASLEARTWTARTLTVAYGPGGYDADAGFTRDVTGGRQ